MPATLQHSLSSLAEISELLSRVTTRDEIAHAVTGRLRTILSAEVCGLFEMSRDGEHAVLIACAGLTSEETRHFQFVPVDTPLPLGQALREREPVFIENAEDWRSRFPEPKSSATPGARVALPLVIDQKVTGAITMTFPEAREFNDTSREFLVSIGHLSAIALERARLFDEHAQHTESLARLHAITASLSSASSKSDVARIINDHLVGTVGAVMTGVMQVSEDRTEFILLNSVNWTEDQRTKLARFPIDMNLPVRDVVRTKAPIYFSDVETWRAAGYAEPPGGFTAAPNGARVALPLLIHDEVVGVVTLTYGRPHVFTSIDRDFLMAVANQCAQAIDRARLYDAEHAARISAEQFANRTVQLQHVASAFAKAMTRDDVARAIVSEIQQGLQPAASAVLELSDDRTRLTLLNSEGASDKAIKTYTSFPVSTPVPASDVALTGEPMFISSRHDWCLHFPEEGIIDSSRNSWVTLPLNVEERTIGVLTMSFLDEHIFTQEEQEFYGAYANQCAVALERARLYEAERDARERAEHANAAKSQFLSIMSHELRTPLNAVIGYADLMLMEVRGKLTAEQRTQVERIRTSAWHQLGLIEEILSYARIEAGREEVRISPVNLGELVNETAELIRAEAQLKGIDVRVNVEADVIVQTDPAKIRQILLNLAGNAVKFTNRGTVDIGLLRRLEDVVCYVADTGPGIPGDKLELIWQPFTQVDSSDTRSVGGTGLGLTIARRLALLLNGRLTVNSEFGKGSRFEFRLPVV